ncbi:MAG: GNAT family N-acetyltransferase [Chitinophagaceae bacterium]
MINSALITERLLLRPWAEADTVPFTKMNSDPEVMKYFPKTLTADETIAILQRIRQHFVTNGFGLFVVANKLTDAFLGFTGFSIPKFDTFFTPCVEIGWRFKKEAWGQGFATEAAAACMKYGFEQLQFDKIVSFTAAINLPSQKVMQRIGMVYVCDFEHPNLPADSNLCKHVLYSLENN